MSRVLDQGRLREILEAYAKPDRDGMSYCDMFEREWTDVDAFIRQARDYVYAAQWKTFVNQTRKAFGGAS